MAAKLWALGTANAFSTTLNGSITDSDSSITLTTVSGLVAPGVLVIDRLDSSNVSTPNTREYISFTGISTSTLTGVSRGLGSSTAQSHSSGAKVEECFSISHWNDLVSFLEVAHDADGNIDTIGAGATLDSPVITTPTGDVVTPTGVQTLTNKRITSRVQSVTNAATVTPTSDTIDLVDITAMGQDFTLANPTGTPTNGQKLLVRIKDDGTARAITHGNGYAAGGADLLTTTTLGKISYEGLIYNTANSLNKWQCVVTVTEA